MQCAGASIETGNKLLMQSAAHLIVAEHSIGAIELSS